jgi:polysaccharide export outer membrane protein
MVDMRLEFCSYCARGRSFSMDFRAVGVSDCFARRAIWILPLLLFCPLTIRSQDNLQTPREANNRIEQLASLVQTHRGEVPVGSGDLLHIDVFDVPDLSRDVRVNESGSISLPLIPGKIQAGGLTTFQLEEKIAELLLTNGLVSHPQVSVFVKEQNSRPITVIGAVAKPMVYQELRPTTLLEVLSQAGGIADDAGSTVLITRRNGAFPTTAGSPVGDNKEGTSAEPQTITIRLKDLLESGDAAYNIPVYGGDVISVPRAGIIYVAGAVQQPGGFVLQNAGDQITALKAIALARGLLGTSKPGQAMIIRNDSNTGRKQEINVDLSKIMGRKAEDVRMYANDILFVPDSKAKRVFYRTGEAAISVTTGLIVYRH